MQGVYGGGAPPVGQYGGGRAPAGAMSASGGYEGHAGSAGVGMMPRKCRSV